MQEYIGIPHPCGGGVFQKGVHDSGVKLTASNYVRVGVECEIAVRLACDLAASGAPFTADSVAGAIEAYLPAQLSDEELAELIEAAIAETGASEQKQMGQVMSALMPKIGGRADGKRISAAVREKLGW